MSIEFDCPACGKHFSVSDESAGKRAKCRACQAPMMVPLLTPAVPPQAVQPAPNIVPAVMAPPAVAQPTASPVAERRSSTPAAPLIFRCPSCNAEMRPQSVFCTSCGFDTIKLRHVKRAGISSEAEKKLPVRAIILGAVTLVVVAAGIALFPSGKPKSPTDQPVTPPVADSSDANSRGPVSDVPFPDPPGTPTSPPAALTDPATTPQNILCPSRPTYPEAIHGLTAYRYQLTGSGPGLPMSVVLFLPTRKVPDHSLPCILLAACGEAPIVGALPTSTDPSEVAAYVQAGFAVAAYEVSGSVPSGPLVAGSPQLAAAVTKFLNADMGLSNGKAAHWFVMNNVPEVDPNRIFASGVGAAGNFAMNLVTTERLQAAAAVAPVILFDPNAESLATSVSNTGIDPTVLRNRMAFAQNSTRATCPVIFVNTGGSNMRASSSEISEMFWRFTGRGSSQIHNFHGMDNSFYANKQLISTIVRFFNRFGAAVPDPGYQSPTIVYSNGSRAPLVPPEEPAAVSFAPDPANLAKLGTATTMFNYTLRLPTGMSPLQGGEVKVYRTEDAHSMTLRMFVQPRTEQAIYPTVTTTRDARPGPHGIPAMLKGASVERGSIGALFFVRMIRAADEPTVIYVGFDGGNLVTIYATASDPLKLDLLETAIRTLAKVP